MLLIGGIVVLSFSFLFLELCDELLFTALHYTPAHSSTVPEHNLINKVTVLFEDDPQYVKRMIIGN